VQDIAAERGQFQNQDYWSVRTDRQRENCVATAGCVRAAYRAAHKNKYHNVVSCIFGGKYTLQGC